MMSVNALHEKITTIHCCAIQSSSVEQDWSVVAAVCRCWAIAVTSSLTPRSRMPERAAAGRLRAWRVGGGGEQPAGGCEIEPEQAALGIEGDRGVAVVGDRGP